MDNKSQALANAARLLVSSSTTPAGASTTALAGATLAVMHDPKILEQVGCSLPVIDSLESAVGQVVLLAIAIALFLFRGKGKSA